MIYELIIYQTGQSLQDKNEAQFFNNNGLAISRRSKFGSSDLPKPSSTMTANTMDAKLLSSFTCNDQDRRYINMFNQKF